MLTSSHPQQEDAYECGYSRCAGRLHSAISELKNHINQSHLSRISLHCPVRGQFEHARLPIRRFLICVQIVMRHSLVRHCSQATSTHIITTYSEFRFRGHISTFPQQHVLHDESPCPRPHHHYPRTHSPLSLLHALPRFLATSMTNPRPRS